jgi:quinol monooxygenase YgiN
MPRAPRVVVRFTATTRRAARSYPFAWQVVLATIVSSKEAGHMGKLAIIATIKTAPGKRDEYLKHLKAHRERCLRTEPGTLTFDILIPQKEADTLMLYEVYASQDAFEAHWTGLSMQQAKQDTEGLAIGMTGVRCDPAE